MQPTMQPGWGNAGQGAAGGPTAQATGGRLTPGARIAGLVICAVLLGVEIAWVVRDVNAAGVHDTVWAWLALRNPAESGRLPATGGLDVVLVAVLVGALIAGRRAAGTWAFLAAGLFVLVFRVPGLWVFTADWTKGAPLHDRALSTAIAFTVGGVVLVLLALLGRQPAAPAPASAGDAEPAPPGAAAGIVGGLALLAIALETVGWQVYYLQKYDDPGYPPHLYKHLVTGEGTLTSLLASPYAYAAWLTAVLAVACAVLAFRRAPAARPLGLALGLLALLDGVIDLCGWHSVHLLFKTRHVPASLVTEQVFAVFDIVAGLLVIVLLAQRGAARPAGPAGPAWTPQQPAGWQAGGQPQAWGSPYQQPPLPPGYQVPHQQSRAGGFGPPPELPPNLPPGTPPPPAGPPSAPPPSGPGAPPRDWPSDSR